MILFDKYLVLQLLCNKIENKVYLVENILNKKKYIIKALFKNVSKDYMIKQYYRKIDILNEINNERVPRIYEIFDNNDWIYVVIEYIDGINLERFSLENNILEEEAVLLFKELVTVVKFLHTYKGKPIIHRDIKPSNVMIDENNRIYLIDFGSVRYYDESKKKDTVKLGTKGYAAPEQYNDNVQTDVRTDIYGMGITMYFLLTKSDPSEPPYEIYPIRYHNKSYSEELEIIIKKCLKLNPDERYQNCDELLIDLNKLLRGEENGT